MPRGGHDRNNPWRPPSGRYRRLYFAAATARSPTISRSTMRRMCIRLASAAMLTRPCSPAPRGGSAAPRPSPYPRERSARSHDRAARLPRGRSADSRLPPTRSRSSWSRSPVSDRGTAGTGSGSRATGCRLRCQHRWHPIARPCLAQRIRIPDSGRRGPGSRPPSHSSAAVASCASTA